MPVQDVLCWSDFCRTHGGMRLMEFLADPLVQTVMGKTLLGIAQYVVSGRAELVPKTDVVRMGDDVLEKFVLRRVRKMLDATMLDATVNSPVIVETVAVASAIVLEAARMNLRWGDLTLEERAFVFDALTHEERVRIEPAYLSFAEKAIESFPEEPEEDLKGEKPVDLATRLMIFWIRNSDQPPAWYTRAWTAALNA